MAIRGLADLTATPEEFAAIRTTVCELVDDPAKGTRFFFESSPVELRQYKVGRFRLIYRVRKVVEIVAVLPGG